ncbi:unnamed protein product [Strongylus vulgaris]|uniref:Uncharacterized protein n=1 Tax=Strongylus vulgaris TaxID=40348 RepID=A0A3P7IAW7_STRVU|nr:unnamed protein product [Strongylus vulgaris]
MDIAPKDESMISLGECLMLCAYGLIQSPTRDEVQEDGRDQLHTLIILGSTVPKVGGIILVAHLIDLEDSY